MPVTANLGRDQRCSTPFGITEVGMSHQGVGRAADVGVLNAFRHHRGGHSVIQLTYLALTGCSTPFGITEVGILGEQPPF